MIYFWLPDPRTRNPGLRTFILQIIDPINIYAIGELMIIMIIIILIIIISIMIIGGRNNTNRNFL